MLNFLHLVISPPESSVLYTGSYDPLLVILSIAVAIFASYASLLVSQHVSTSMMATTRRLWLVGGGLSLGCGIWAMHFVGLLAFSLPCSTSYDATLTMLSMIPGVFASILALKIISRRELSHTRLAVGGLLIGVGIGAMHYTGMAAMRLNGLIRYDVKLFLLSILVAVALATLALWIKFRLKSCQSRWNTWVTMFSAAVMGLAVSGMHYTAMAAAYFIRNGDSTTATTGISPTFLSVIVLSATSLTVVVTIVATYVGKHNVLSFRRSYWLIGLLIAGWSGVAWLSANYYYDSLADDLYLQEVQRAERRIEDVAGHIGDNVKLLKGLSLVVSRDDDTYRALRRFGADAEPSAQAYEERKQRWTRNKMLGGLNDTLHLAASNLGADNIFIINAAGDCIAAGNADKPGSPVGTNFADRIYFPQVRVGRPGQQYAVGRTTNIPGLFYAYPVLETGRFLGAVVVKLDITRFASLVSMNDAFITDLNDVIVLASDKRLELHALPDAAVWKLSEEKRLSQYKRSVLEPLSVSRWGEVRFPDAVLIGGQKIPSILAHRKLPEEAIVIYVPRSLNELVRLGSERNWFFVLLATAGSILIIALSAVLLYMRELQKTETDLRIAATAFETQGGMLITDANSVILRVNRAFFSITGYSAEEVIGRNPRMFRSDRHDADFYADMWASINNTGTWEGEIWNRRKNGEIYPEYLIITAVKDKNDVLINYVASLMDITVSKAAEDEIRNLAFYDTLTRLPNRRLLLDRLRHALMSSARSGNAGALLFIDLDNFKTLNDTLGHDIGDQLLQEVALRLTNCVREGDTVGRLGGDEFVVMLKDLSGQSLEAAAQTEAVGEKILCTLRQSYLLATHEYHSTASIGATLFSDDQLEMDELMKQADIAMYQAKKAGRNALRFFDPQMQDSINARADLEGELRKALENRQFILYYQIQVDSAGRPMGAETLIRWIHPERGMVSPVQFIPLAEETGLILPIGLWVLETACAQIKAWQQNELTRDLVLAVNVSARQFRQADFVAQVQAVVQHHAIKPGRLKLELTEGMLLENIEEIIVTMNALKEIGIQFSLDDFGTGYSSLQYLKLLPLDQLKIDQSFVRDITFDSSDRAIVGTIIAMAHGLDLNVIAEGVETEEQRLLLLSKGCAHFQGYLFSKPVPVAQFEALLKQA
jgi:diguanylate cyclase (GGDEF)-like protein/PAS domain S-box-containing protein